MAKGKRKAADMPSTLPSISTPGLVSAKSDMDAKAAIRVGKIISLLVWIYATSQMDKIFYLLVSFSVMEYVERMFPYPPYRFIWPIATGHLYNISILCSWLEV